MAVADESYVEGKNGSFVSYMIDIVEKWTGLEILEGSLHYLDYLLWVFTPLIIVFILPLFIILFLYLSILFLHMYKRKRELQEAYSNNFWDGARKTLATLWDGHATIWHGYEVHGLEKIPDAGPALIVYYHGAIPVDYYYFLAKVIIQKGRTCHSVADHFLFKLPGFKLLLEVFSVMHGPQEECVKALKSGHLLAISPGGVREALFSDETYGIFWRGRKGFAQVAIDAQVPIIPMFTRNIREGFRTFGCFGQSSQLDRHPIHHLKHSLPPPPCTVAAVCTIYKNALQQLTEAPLTAPSKPTTCITSKDKGSRCLGTPPPEAVRTHLE
ncbi:DGAT1/2-independent enzyme synthesizing storage lipids isoform X4 [Cetorhinus maximus]